MWFAVLGLLALLGAPLFTVICASAMLGFYREGTDLSVVAICPDETAEQAPLPISSVSIPSAEIGTGAVDLLMAKLAERDGVPETTMLPAALTERATSAAVSSVTARRPEDRLEHTHTPGSPGQIPRSPSG